MLLLYDESINWLIQAIGMTDKSHNVKVTRSIIFTGLFTILCHILEIWYNARDPILGTVLKFLFYSDILLMVGSWYEVMLIAKSQVYNDRDVAKAMLFTLLFLILTEIQNIIGGV